MNRQRFCALVGLPAAIVVSAAAVTASASVITQWTFDDTSVNPAVGTTNPAVGSGTASLLGGTTASFATGIGGTGTFGWNVTTFAAQSAESGLRGAQFNVSTLGTTGATGLAVSFDLRTSNTSSRWFRLDHTTDGTTWQPGSPTLLGTAGVSAGDAWNAATVPITDPAALNNAAFALRIVSVFSPDAFTQVNGGINYLANTAYEVARNGQGGGTASAYGGGTWRFDNVALSAVPEPATLSLAAAVALGYAALRPLRRTSKAGPLQVTE